MARSTRRRLQRTVCGCGGASPSGGYYVLKDEVARKELALKIRWLQLMEPGAVAWHLQDRETEMRAKSDAGTWKADGDAGTAATSWCLCCIPSYYPP